MYIFYKKAILQCQADILKLMGDALKIQKELRENHPEKKVILSDIQSYIEKLYIFQCHIEEILNNSHEHYQKNKLEKILLNSVPPLVAVFLAWMGLIDYDEKIIRYMQLSIKRMMRIVTTPEYHYELSKQEHLILSRIENLQNEHYCFDVQETPKLIEQLMADSYEIEKKYN